MLKIAYCAGHYLGTAGKRLPKELDANETREWTLNDRVAQYFALAAKEYEGVSLYRTDDETGKIFVDIPERVKQANDWGADLYLDFHHNAAGKIFTGGGVEAYCYPGSVEGKKYRDAIYKAVVAAGGLKGNRVSPLQEKKFDSLSLTNMPAVLIEYGYMDSSVDAPIILSDAYAKKVGYATFEAVAALHGLKKKPTYTEADFVKDVLAAVAKLQAAK
jgi:N-acetylmuramoyl-L-alanine amidase